MAEEKLYISDFISEADIDMWTADRLVNITSGTGSGKSHFILNTLLEYTKKRNKRVLMLVPRTTLRDQLVQYLSEDDISITIKTYQWLEHEILEHGMDFQYIFDYVIADESHYFFHDASFNRYTEYSFSWILKQEHAIKVFMSATSEDLEKFLKDTLDIPMDKYSIPKNYHHVDHIRFYSFHDKASRFQVWLSELQKIVERGDKAVVFIDNMKELKRFKRALRSKALLLHGQSQNPMSKGQLKGVEHIIKNETIAQQVLLTTSALDVGITLVDEKITDMFIESSDEIQITQMIGRKRPIDKSDRVKLHMYDISTNSLNGYRSQLANRLKALYEIDSKEKGSSKRHALLTDYLVGNKSLPTGVNLTFQQRQDEDGKTIFSLSEEDVKVAKLVFLSAQSQHAYYDSVLKGKAHYKGTDDLSKQSKFAQHILSTYYHFNLTYSNYVEEKKKVVSVPKARDKELNVYYSPPSPELITLLENGESIDTKEEKERLLSLIDYKINYRQVRSHTGINDYFKLVGLPYVLVSEIMNKKEYEIYLKKLKNNFEKEPKISIKAPNKKVHWKITKI